MDAIVAFDADGSITLVNSAARANVRNDRRRRDRERYYAVLPERRGARRTRRSLRVRDDGRDAGQPAPAFVHCVPGQWRNVSARGVGFLPRWSDREDVHDHRPRCLRANSPRRRARVAGGVARRVGERAQAAQRGAAPATGRSRARDDGAQPFLRVDEPRATHADQRRARL